MSSPFKDDISKTHTHRYYIYSIYLRYIRHHLLILSLLESPEDTEDTHTHLDTQNIFSVIYPLRCRSTTRALEGGLFGSCLSIFCLIIRAFPVTFVSRAHRRHRRRRIYQFKPVYTRIFYSYLFTKYLTRIPSPSWYFPLFSWTYWTLLDPWLGTSYTIYKLVLCVWCCVRKAFRLRKKSTLSRDPYTRLFATTLVLSLLTTSIWSDPLCVCMCMCTTQHDILKSNRS